MVNAIQFFPQVSYVCDVTVVIQEKIAKSGKLILELSVLSERANSSISYFQLEYCMRQFYFRILDSSLAMGGEFL